LPFIAATTHAAFTLAGNKRIVFPVILNWHVVVPDAHLPAESSEQADLTSSFVRCTLKSRHAERVDDINYEYF
jgi:hypothetical protein